MGAGQAVAAAAGSKAPPPRDAVRRGEELIADGRPQEAAAFLRDAIAREPRNATLHFTLAAALGRQQDFDGAIAAFRAGLALAPHSLIARRGLALAQRRKGDLAGARATLEALWQDAPSFRPAGEDLAEVMAAQGDRAGAIQTYRYLIDTHMPADDPRLAATYVGLGKVLEAEGDRAGARAAYRDALRRDPKHAPAQAALKRVSR
jgi:tetratricopeptide (TPR) repeat protein